MPRNPLPLAVDVLRAATGCTLDRAIQAAPWLSAAATRFDLVTPLRLGHFLAQCAHESLLFERTAEAFSYSDPARIFAVFRARFDTIDQARAFVRAPERLANFVYANRGGNGPEASGDGWLYRGRAYIGVTFRFQYRHVGAKLNIPAEAQPELLENPEYAALASALYFSEHCIAAADKNDATEVTRGINPALLELDRRRQLTERALRALGYPQ